MSPAHDALHPESRFEADWLALREGADADARSPELTALAARWLNARGGTPFVCVDLGSGSGSNLRFLAPRLPGPQSWCLVDHDASLLERAVRGSAALRDAAGQPVALRSECRDLAALAPDAFAGVDLVCASALMDLVGAAWLERLAEACARAGAAALFSLSVDGAWSFRRGPHEDTDPDDALARDAFNAHQRRDKGVGGALGPDAHAHLAASLRAVGYRVHMAPSPWQLHMDRPRELALAAALMQGWYDAALAQMPAEAARLRAWHVRRREALRDPAFRMSVGHVDVFACPGGERAGAEPGA